MNSQPLITTLLLAPTAALRPIPSKIQFPISKALRYGYRECAEHRVVFAVN